MAAPLVAAMETKDSKGKVSKVPELPAKARNEICRYLASIAGEAEVAAYAEALQDFEVREMARWALSRMTCAAATAALAKVATEGVGNEFRIGAINALGSKSGSVALAALKTCAADPTPEIRLAAAEALANSAIRPATN